jgi:hypothetical protein
MKKYNSKDFLLPDSINSCAMYHAKIFPDGNYMFRIHDCNTGIRLVGDLKSPVEAAEAVTKLRKLARAAADFAAFIEDNCMDSTKFYET